METRPGLKDCLFSEETQKCLIQRIIDYVKQKGVVKATPLFGTIPPEEPSFNVSGHQTSQNFLKDQSECTIDTLRFDLLAQDLTNPLMSNDPVFLTWMVRYPSCCFRNKFLTLFRRCFGSFTSLRHFVQRLLKTLLPFLQRSTLNTLTNAWLCTLQASNPLQLDFCFTLHCTGSIDYNDRTNTEITTLEAPTAVSKEWHLYEQFASLVPQ